MKNGKRTFAIIGIIILVLMIGLILVFNFSKGFRQELRI